MAENDFNSLIESMGAKVIEDSSLTNENKEVTPEKAAEATTTETAKVENTENAKTEEVKTVVTETAKVEETKTAETATTEVKTTEVPVTEKKSYKAYDLVSNINKEFEAEYGISINTAQEFVSVNYDDPDMDEREIIADYLSAKTVGITQKEIDAELRVFSLLYKPQADIDKMLEDGTLTEEAFSDLDAKLTGLKREATTFLKGRQNIAQKALNEFEVEQEYDSSPTNEAGKKLAELTNTFLPTYTNVSVDIIDKDGKKVDTINYATDEAGKKLVSDIVSDPSNVYKLWMDDKGTIDVQKMAKDIYKLRNSERIDKALYDHAYAKGAGSITKEISNMDFNKKTTDAGQGQKAIDPNLQKLLNNLNGG